jgi:chitinase
MFSDITRFFRATATIAGAIALLSSTPPAHAANVVSITVTGANDFANSCLISADITVTGTTNDVANLDRVRTGATNSDGQIFEDGSAGVNVPVASTATFIGEPVFVVSTSSPLRSNYFFTLFEDTSFAPLATLTPIGSAPVPRSMLIAAGGDCVAIAANAAPVANAGPDQNFTQGSVTVNLSAAGSDADGDPLTYQWIQRSGPSVTISSPTTPATSFNLPAQTNATQTFVFEIEVTDGIETSFDDLIITLEAIPNQPPVVNAGPDQTVTPNANVSLTATATDNESDPMTFVWSQVGGPAVTLSATATLTTGFTAPAKTNAQQDIILQFAANDGLNTSTDQVTVSVPANLGPTANAGPDQTVAGLSPVALSGAASADGDGDPITYAWVQTAGPAVTLTNTTSATPGFAAPAKTNAAQVLTFELTINDGLTSVTDTVDITVAANLAPTANAGPDQTVAPAASVSLNGAGSSDGDGDTITSNWTQLSGPAVTLTGATSLTPGFAAPAKTQAPQVMVFELTINDGLTNATDTVQITVPGNVGPTADAGADQTVAGGDVVTLIAAGSVDGDGDPLTYAWTLLSGPSVTLSSATATTPSFTAPAKTNAAQVMTFELVANDGFTTDSDTVAITVAANLAPTANAGPDQTIASGAAGASLSSAGSSDPDGDPLTYSWVQTSGPVVVLSNASGPNPTFSAPPVTAGPQVVSFTLTVGDGLTTGTDSVDITFPANTPPTANAGPDTNVGQGAVVTLTGAASSDVDNQALSYAWTQISGPAVALSGATSVTPSFTAPAVAVPTPLVFSLQVQDGLSTSAPDSVTITVQPNQPPVVSAGPDQTIAGSTPVALAGTATDLENDPLTYQWTQTAGPSVTLTGATSLAPTFTAPAKTNAVQVLTFALGVNDGFSTVTDTVDISIIANVGPTANAGPDQTVAGLSSVSLTGAASTDGDNDTLTYAWVQVSGPVVTLTGDTTATPGFVAPQRALVAQTLVFELTVGDGFSTANDQVTVTVPANIAPVANAGADQNTSGGASVTLDGSGSSDAESDPITYSWTQSAGPAVTLSAATSASPSFTAPAKTNAIQTLTFDLVVNDGAASSAVDQVSVSVAANVGPTANAGPDQTVAGLSSVSLTGAASTDGDNDTLTYAWVQVSGPAVALSGASTTSPTFTAPAKTANAQTLVFELTVSDGLLAGIDTVLVSVAPNMAPLANAGADQSVAGQSSVTLDGSGSTDPDGDTLTYSWTQTAGPVVTLSDASAVSPVFTAPRGQASATTLTFTLSVSDGVVSTTDTIDVVIAPNNPPVANAGADLGPIDSGQTVTLNGSASTDPDSDPLTYAWSQVSGTAVTLAGANTATPSFVAPLVNGFEDLVFELIVNDGQVASQPDRVAVTIRAVGQITIVQRVIGADRQFVFTSSVASLSATVQTSGGVGQIQAQQVPAGRYTVSGPDLTAAGYALTALACNDADSIVDLANRSVALVLSPNEELVCTYTSADTRTAAQTAITDFLGVRGAALLSHQPDLQRRLDRLEGRTPVGGQVTVGGFAVPGMSGLPVSLALADGQARFATSLSALRATPSEGGSVTGPDIDVWAEGYFSSLDYAGHEGDFALIYVGGDVRVGQNVLIGVLAQFDTFERTGA